MAEADEWRRCNEPIPIEDILADFGLSMADWERLAKAPLPEENASPSA